MVLASAVRHVLVISDVGEERKDWSIGDLTEEDEKTKFKNVHCIQFTLEAILRFHVIFMGY